MANYTNSISISKIIKCRILHPFFFNAPIKVVAKHLQEILVYKLILKHFIKGIKYMHAQSQNVARSLVKSLILESTCDPIRGKSHTIASTATVLSLQWVIKLIMKGGISKIGIIYHQY